MSQTSRHLPPTTGPDARRTRSRATAAAVAFAVACALASPTVASAADPTPSPTVTPTSVATLSASADGGGVVVTGEALRTATTVTNPTATTLPAGVVRASIAPTTLATAAAVSAWLDGSSTIATTDLTPSVVPAIAAGDQATISLLTLGTDPILSSLTPGVHAMSVTYTAGLTTLVERTVITVRAATATAAQAALVVPVTTSATTDGLLSAETLQELTAPDGELTAVLEGLRTAPEALIAIDPALVASIRALGSSAPETAQTWLDLITWLPNERVALQFADADVSAQFAAGLTAPLAPSSLDWAMSASNFAVDDAPDPSPSPTPSVSATAEVGITLPDAQQLTAIDTDFSLWWPAAGAADTRTLTAAGAETAIMVSSAHTGGGVGHLSSGATDLLAYDAELADVLGLAAGETDDLTRDGLLAHANALLQFQATASGGRALFAAFDRDTVWDADALRSTLATLAVGGVTQPIATSVLLGTAGASATVAAVEPDATRVGAVQEILADEARLAPFATVLTEPDLLLGRERARGLRLLSAAWMGAEDYPGIVAAQHDRVEAILRSVEIIQPKKVTLVSSGSSIPMFVRNDLPFEVTLDLIATPEDIRLQVQGRTPVVAAANSTTRTAVPVTAKISNGDVRISLELRSATGELIGASKYADVSVRADWEAIGLVVLASLVALLLGFGTYRTLRRRRRNAQDGVVEERRPSRKEARAAYRAPDSDDMSAAAPEEDERG